MRHVWILTDNKPGHRSQLEGLCQRLLQRLDLQFSWLLVADLPPMTPLHWLRRDNPWPEYGEPDWVIGAGQRTHLPTAMCGRIFGARTVMLMRPSLPYSWYDACITSRHDEPPQRMNVLITEGVMNTMQPVTTGREQQQGVFLLGGINEHYHWEEPDLLHQIKAICEARPDMTWTATTSRRTPPGFVPALRSLEIANLKLIPVEETAPGWVKTHLMRAGEVWVTRDSVSMVYESITAAAPTGLLTMRPLRQSRVVGAMDQVLAETLAHDFNQVDLKHPLPAPVRTFWEAERAAAWLQAWLESLN